MDSSKIIDRIEFWRSIRLLIVFGFVIVLVFIGTYYSGHLNSVNMPFYYPQFYFYNMIWGFIGFVIFVLLIFWLFSRSWRYSYSNIPSNKNSYHDYRAVRYLQRRYARGEITKKEYDQIIRDLNRDKK